MQVIVSDFGNAAKKIKLVGKLDFDGACDLESVLEALAGARSSIVVDMTAVDFIASIGIRYLVMAGKTVASGAGKLVLLDPARW